MIDEKQIDDVKTEAYKIAVSLGSRAAVAFVVDVYPEQARNILMQVSVQLEAMKHSKLSSMIDKLTENL